MNVFDFPEPHSELTPQDVVKIQLDALQNNDLMGGNMGIRVAYRFASPQNQAITGTLEQFIEMVKNPLYEKMIGFNSARLDSMYIYGNMAQQRVHLTHHNGYIAMFVFTLSRQTDGCWMTDSVIPQG